VSRGAERSAEPKGIRRWCDTPVQPNDRSSPSSNVFAIASDLPSSSTHARNSSSSTSPKSLGPLLHHPSAVFDPPTATARPPQTGLREAAFFKGEEPHLHFPQPSHCIPHRRLSFPRLVHPRWEFRAGDVFARLCRSHRSGSFCKDTIVSRSSRDHFFFFFL
jgi:hypothetical protein